MKEIWKDIPGYGGKYQASTLGRIRRTFSSYKTTCWGKSVTRKTSKVFLVGKSLSSKGYPRVNLQKRVVAVHRVIAITFLPVVPGKLAVNHKNGIKTDNRIENLEWVSNKENSIHAMSNGLLNISGLLTKKLPNHVVEEILMLRRSGLLQREIGEIVGYPQQTISKILLRNKNSIT